MGPEGGSLVAHVGDHLIVRARQGGNSDRDALIVEVRGQDGGPPFLVRWTDDGHEGLVFPGPDVVISHCGEAS